MSGLLPLLFTTAYVALLLLHCFFTAANTDSLPLSASHISGIQRVPSGGGGGVGGVSRSGGEGGVRRAGVHERLKDEASRVWVMWGQDEKRPPGHSLRYADVC
jgi:hypothetical protein